MFAKSEDLLTLAGAGGRFFEELLFDLVVAEGSRHGIKHANVHWDHRTNRADGGRDIIVDAEHNDAAPRFIPQRRSIWSAKSGMDGLNPSTLRAELLKPAHSAIRVHLQRGDSYVWCTLQAIDEDGRTALREKVVELSQAPDVFFFNPNLVEYRTLADLCAILNDHPGLIAKHLAEVARRYDGVLSLAEWQREDRFGSSVSWVDFAARSSFIDRIRDHLRARSGPNVLHLAGLSGVGKTRTVREACQGQRDLEEVLYVPRLASLSEAFLRHLTRNNNLQALVVVDEVPLEEMQAFAGRVKDCSRGLRFVTIGPALRRERDRPFQNFWVLPVPETKAGVLLVVKQAGDGLSIAVLESIADYSAQDLRLALMLVDATRRNGDYRDLPISDGSQVWERITSLFRNSLKNPTSFRDNYPRLTIGVDIGMRGEHREELQYVADHFKVPIASLDEIIADASACGLGVSTPNFFEPTPRALASHLFRSWVWTGLRNGLPAFLGGLTERFLRRFVERCYDCTGAEREEMEEELALFFRAALGEPDVKRLIDRQRSRLFAAWAELDPSNGLSWLRDAVIRASDHDLTAFDGNPDGSGGWRGRRQVVWLCEALASFGEVFWICEEILFRLAQVETEPAIGNNSTAIWSSLFHPALGLTEVPFHPRGDRLMQRLREADERTLSLILSAVVQALGVVGGRVMPPSVVGGRLTPDYWHPSTVGEMGRLQQDLGRRTLAVAAGLPPELLGTARQFAIRHLHTFASRGLVTELRTFLDADAELRQAIRMELHQIVTHREEVQRGRPQPAPPNPVLQSILAWYDELAPRDLAARIKELTAMNPWDVMRNDRRREGDADMADSFTSLAEEVLLQPQVMEQLTEWFNSDGPKSAFHFGHALGATDVRDAIAPIVTSWVEVGHCLNLVAGYLRGVAVRLGGLPDHWSRRLDAAAEKNAEYAVALTIESCQTRAGILRINSLLDADKVALGYLRGLASSEWDKVLTPTDKAEILNAVLNRSGQDLVFGYKVGLTLVADWSGWGRTPLLPELATAATRLLLGSLETYADIGAWSAVLESLAASCPDEAAGLAMAGITKRGPSRVGLEDVALKVLLKIAGTRPEVVMASVGECLLDQSRRVFFAICHFSGLFEAIGLPVLLEWLNVHDPALVKYVARHLDSPFVEEGRPIVPPVTEWLLTAYESDDRIFGEFCAGRHSGKFLSGSAQERRPALEEAVRPFLNHPLRRVREWAHLELAENEYEAKLDEEMDERDERL